MQRKVYLKPPAPTRTILWAQIIILLLFLPLGGIMVYLSDGDARPYAALFAVIWTVAVISMLVFSVRSLRLVKKGDIEIAAIDAATEGTESEFAVRLRDLEALKKDGLISDWEYQSKRDEIMKEKW